MLGSIYFLFLYFKVWQSLCAVLGAAAHTSFLTCMQNPQGDWVLQLLLCFEVLWCSSWVLSWQNNNPGLGGEGDPAGVMQQQEQILHTGYQNKLQDLGELPLKVDS